MTGELSSILGHIDTISALDLDGRGAHVAGGGRRERAARRRAAAEPAARDRPGAGARTPTARASACPAPAHERPAGPDRRPGRRADRRRRAVRARAVRRLPRPRRRRRAERLPVGGRRAPPNVADGPLAGVPLAVKDLFCTEGVPSQAASRILEGYRPPYTATAVRRLTEAGAALLGKTNMDEFAMGSSNENSGFGPVRNPWDTDQACRAARPAAAPPRWPRASRRGRSAPTPAARSASPPRCAASSASSPPTAPCRATA